MRGAVLLTLILLSLPAGRCAADSDVHEPSDVVVPGPRESKDFLEISSPARCQVLDSSWKGSYYRKIAAPAGYLGLTGTLMLPVYAHDPTRYYHVDHSKPDVPMTWEGPLDQPSVYVGASNPANGKEIDAGLNRKPIYRAKGRRILTDTNIPWQSREPQHQYVLEEDAKPPVLYDPKGDEIATGWPSIEDEIKRRNLSYFFAFVPFWRTQTWNMDDTMAFLPGESVKMTIRMTGPDRFRLELASPGLSFEKDFDYPGFGRDCASCRLKRVNSIDQFHIVDGRRKGNEGPGVSAIPTKASALLGGWSRAMLLRPDGAQVPFGPPRCAIVRPVDLIRDYDKVFRSSGVDPRTGAESLDIVP